MNNNLAIINTGLDHCYINGIPIVEAEVNISDIFKRVSRVSSLATHGDPHFANMGEERKNFSELHGEGDRITSDFLKEGAEDLRSLFSPLQRLIPEGVYDATPVEYQFLGNTGNSEWTNPEPTNIYVDSILIRSTAGFGDVTFIVDGDTLGTVSLPIGGNVSEYLAYDLSGYLGGISTVINYEHSENVRNNNIAQTIQLVVSNASPDFEYDYKIVGAKYNAIGWVKALTEAGDVRLPAYNSNIRVGYLIVPYSWYNSHKVKVTGITVKHNSGSADVTIRYNSTDSAPATLSNNTIGVDLFGVSDFIETVSVILDNETDDFSYDLIINTQLPKTLPSPRFEYDSLWNPGKIIYRYQNMDTRLADQKLNYTSETLRDIRVDPNIFDEVVKYANDSLVNYVLKELYLVTGHDKKALAYATKYKQSRDMVKFWVRSEKGLQTQYHYAGV